MILWMIATLPTSQNWGEKKTKQNTGLEPGLEPVFLLLTNFRPQKYDFNLYKGFFMGKK
jgi:hypothetical protein